MKSDSGPVAPLVHHGDHNVHTATPGTLPVRQTTRSGTAPSRHSADTATHSAASLLMTSVQAAREVFDCSERKFHALRKEPWFTARPRVLGPRTIRWVRHELEAAALNAPAAQTAMPEPETLLRGKIERLKRGPAPDAGQAAASGTPSPTKPGPTLAAVPA